MSEFYVLQKSLVDKLIEIEIKNNPIKKKKLEKRQETTNKEKIKIKSKTEQIRKIFLKSNWRL